PERASDEAGELVHLVAVRVATGETLDAVVAPRGSLAKRTEDHAEVPRARLLAGMSRAAFHDAWRGFVRGTDIVCTWGAFSRDVVSASGVVAPEWLDVRRATRAFFKHRIGSLETFHAT